MNEIEKFCKKHNLTIDQFHGKEPITGDLDLRSVTALPDGFNPTVGGYLYWKDKSKRIGANVPEIKRPIIDLSWQNGKYKKIDGIFCEMMHEHPHTVAVLIVSKN
jgi:hypothetical protein